MGRECLELEKEKILSRCQKCGQDIDKTEIYGDWFYCKTCKTEFTYILRCGDSVSGECSECNEHILDCLCTKKRNSETQRKGDDMFGIKKTLENFMKQQNDVVEKIRKELAELNDSIKCHEYANTQTLYDNITSLNNMLNEFKGMVAMERAQYKRIVEESKENEVKKKKNSKSKKKIFSDEDFE